MYRCLILVLCLGLVSRVQTETSCSGEEKSPACIYKIETTFTKNDFFWWGTWYNTNCPNGNTNLYCNKANQLSGSTLKANIGGLDETGVDRFLHVEYKSTAGTYSGCDTTYTRTTDWTFSLDPLATDTYPSWDARLRPKVSWTKREETTYTLIILDIGVGIVHGVWANIDGNTLPAEGWNLDAADEVWAYRGPKNPFYERQNAYVFFLFSQSGHITIASSDFQTPFALQTTLSTFKSTYGLTGPVAANWLLTEGDIFGTAWMKQNNIMYNCPSYIKRASLNSPHNTRPFLPSNSQLDVFIHAKLSAAALDYTMCCQAHSAPATSFTLDAVTDPTLTAVGTRSGDSTTQEFTFEKAASGPAEDLTGERHTLISVDPDVPFPSKGTNSHPILHLLVTNIQDGNFGSGDVIQSYAGPLLPFGEHFYYFLLYKQLGSSDFTFTLADVQDEYIGSELETCNRCLFDINGFVTDKNLQLVGATWMKAEHDSYVDYFRIKSGANATEYCSDVEGWEYGKTCGACNLMYHVSFLVLGWIMSQLLK